MTGTAYMEGYWNGRMDRLIGYASGYALFVESAPGYSREYSRGYRAGLSGG